MFVGKARPGQKEVKPKTELKNHPCPKDREADKPFRHPSASTIKKDRHLRTGVGTGHAVTSLGQ